MTESAALSVVLAGGGTAGHISPLLAIARALVEARPDARVLAVGTAAGMETRLVPAAGFRLETIERVPMPRRPSVDLLKLPVRLVRAVRQALRIIDAAQADVVVGVGGYVSTPLYLAAWIRRVPVAIHEANARPGLANRLGARIARSVAVAFRGTGLPDEQWVGMPMRREISTLDRAAARRKARVSLGLDPDRATLIVTGGSSGAASINRAVAAAAPKMVDDAAQVQVLHITGRGKQVPGPDGALLAVEGYRQVEYVDGMENVYAAADLLLARAGAATVCEVAAVGLPTVFVPLPHGNGEQRRNASGLVDAGAALMIEDAQLTGDWLLTEALPLVQDPVRLENMSRAAAPLGVRDADVRMAELIIDAAGGRS
ncbi:UDP-N-acetylglucosamine--N-acetylmuramyl-(pentapeptide) pyrophosphoryl-undecaprenol N-acetylglucosamine transferase [Arthrobacter sp. Soil782]|uniref:undecaprenyldiphospho-muramoylpentapeptide beta-N-acetylglucosaminyltransferase n=1 Tax=Arthrobacter sp. Soil782 TaxID=1736410 RepID=UPI0006F89DE6|nr:undecaprenyldiphospho-muramoylpentapeptide beta-N-acetylglucosaminyltransferase [Arthrobacter sp. Soil782]KRF06130.1 UDP-N-acetylglucosamine--N-acetylmuramyl-(pentapeptide) pyrophosphoryl-undecaprenol N-acetylglucosamine transferase [Arthrobacter sp. Soil782]